MSVTETRSTTTRLAEILPRIMGFARLMQGLARRFKGFALFMAVSGLLSALFLAWLVAKAWGLGLIWVIVLGVIMLLPVLVIGWSWYVLDQASSLPERLVTWAGQAKDYASDTVQRLQADAGTAQSESKIGDLKQLGGLAYEVTSMGMDAKDLMAILGGSLSLANPLFLLFLMLSTGAVLMMDVVAMITGLTRLFG